MLELVWIIKWKILWMGIKEKFERMKHNGRLLIRDNWDYALACGIAEVPILARDGYIQLPSSLEELILLGGAGLMGYSAFKNESSINFLRKARDFWIILYGGIAGNWDAGSPLAPYEALLSFEAAGMSLAFQYLFVRERARSGAYNDCQ